MKYSDWIASWKGVDWGIDYRERQEIFLVFTVSRSLLGFKVVESGSGPSGKFV
jgi:hypothetical protein